MAAFLDHSFGRYGAGSVHWRVCAIRRVLLGLGLADVTHAEPVKLAVRRGKRTYGARAKQATPLNAALRDRIRAACPDDLRGLRDRAFLSLGDDTLCRASELSALRIEDLEVLPDGTGRIAERKEKQDPGGAGGVGYISARGMADVRAWLEAARLKRGPILRPIFFRRIGSEGWGRRAMSERVETLALNAGLEPALARRLTCQSLRIGAVHDLVIGGASILQIMRAGRWRDVQIVAYYARNVPINMWGQTDGDGLPLAASFHPWRARALRRGLGHGPQTHWFDRGDAGGSGRGEGPR